MPLTEYNTGIKFILIHEVHVILISVIITRTTFLMNNNRSYI